MNIVSRVITRLGAYDVRSTIDALSPNTILCYWSDTIETNNNFGDALNPEVIKYLTSRIPNNLYNALNLRSKDVYYFIGSTLDRLKTKQAIVCGAGFKKEYKKVRVAPKKILAVRGPLTKEVYNNSGIYCPDVFCDPALLLPRIVKPSKVKKWKVGITPHYIDKPLLKNIKIDYPESSFRIIDIESSISNIVEEITSCDYILSSSLHGIIAANAYNIPAVWLELSDNIAGGKFKFHDYLLSLELSHEVNPYMGKDVIEIDKALELSFIANTDSKVDNYLSVMKRHIEVALS